MKTYQILLFRPSASGISIPLNTRTHVVPWKFSFYDSLKIGEKNGFPVYQVNFFFGHPVLRKQAFFLLDLKCHHKHENKELAIGLVVLSYYVKMSSTFTQWGRLSPPYVKKNFII